MANLRTKPIFTDVPGALPYTYDIPSSLELVVQSIVARFDGAGAAATFIPCLSIYTQDGHLMARVRPDQEFAVGDTGVVTWAPFLRRSSRAGPGCTVTIGGGTGKQTFTSGAQAAVSFSGATYDPSGMWSAGSPTRITANIPGSYIVTARLIWDGNAAGIRGIDVRANGVQVLGGQNTNALPGAYVTNNNTAHVFTATAAGQYMELLGYQDSGGNLAAIVGMSMFFLRPYP